MKPITKTATQLGFKELREKEELRLYEALAKTDPGSDAYTKILTQITSLTSHDRASEHKLIEEQMERSKQLAAADLEQIKATKALELEREKQSAARTQKMIDVGSKVGAIALVLFFEANGHAVISKSFGFVKD